MVERIAQTLRHGRGPGLEFFPVAGVTGDEAFIDAVGTQAAPFVVIAFEPHVRQVGEARIGGDVFGRQVTVVVDDRLVRGVIVVERLGPLGFEQEIAGDEDVFGRSFRNSALGSHEKFLA